MIDRKYIYPNIKKEEDNFSITLTSYVRVCREGVYYLTTLKKQWIKENKYSDLESEVMIYKSFCKDAYIIHNCCIVDPEFSLIKIDDDQLPEAKRLQNLRREEMYEQHEENTL